MPIKAGDTGYVNFADQDIGGWVTDGDTSPPDSNRRHSLSDAMFTPSQGTGPADPDNFKVFFEDISIVMSPGGSMEITAPGGVNITSPTLTHNGTNIGDDHVHGGVTSGGSNTAGPQ